MILDKIFQQKIGIGPAQYIPLVFISLVDLNDGAQLILSSFLTPIIQSQWHLSQSQASTLASIFYLGAFFGSIISGKLSDLYGRRPLIVLGSVMQIVVSSAFFVVNTYGWMVFVRFCYGFSYGFTIAITTSVFAEITPGKYRGKGILLLNFCVSLGKLYGLLLAYIFLDTFTTGNWRWMMIFSCIPNLFVFFGSVLTLNESPRFLIAKKNFQPAFQILDKMIITNNPNSTHKIEQSQKQQIINYYTKKFQTAQRAQFKSLFNNYYIKTTFCLSLAWFSINFIYFGQLVALPFIFGKAKKSFTSYTITVLGETPSFLLSIFLVDRPNFGRKSSLFYFFTLSALMHFLFALSPMILFSSVARFFMKMCFQMLYPCTTQSYGFGFNSAIGRIGATIMPYIILPLVSANTVYIFFLFVLFSLLGSLASFILPHQTMDRVLDYRTDTQGSDYRPSQNRSQQFREMTNLKQNLLV